MNTSLKKVSEHPEMERRWVFLVLIFVGGFYGAYTLTVRGGVFCNAQTANMALFGMALAGGNWWKAAYYLIPMGAYLLGILLSEALQLTIRRPHTMRWGTMLTVIELAAVVIVGLIPASAPHQICQIIINFICAMQFNTFRQAEGISMSTTFCTNHLRMFGANLVALIHNSNADAAVKVKAHGLMLLCFMAGGFTAALLCRFFDVRAIWGAVLPLCVLFADLLRADFAAKRKEMAVPSVEQQ